jgi:hypothetical protein
MTERKARARAAAAGRFLDPDEVRTIIYLLGLDAAERRSLARK